MSRIGGNNLIVMAVVLVVAGLFLRWDLVDWLIDAVGMIFIVVGVVAGAVGVFRSFSGRKEHQAST